METWITDVKNVEPGVKMSRAIEKTNAHKNELIVVFFRGLSLHFN